MTDLDAQPPSDEFIDNVWEFVVALRRSGCQPDARLAELLVSAELDCMAKRERSQRS